MENPYAPPELTPELATEERRRPKMWRALLVAYGVHFLLSMLGFVVGLCFAEPGLTRVFPLESPWVWPLKLVSIPFAVDLFAPIEPFLIGKVVPPTYVAWRWLRTGVWLTSLIAGVSYALWKRRWLLIYVGITSFIIALSFAISFPADMKESRSVRTASGPGLVPARGPRVGA
jgi:hypothetical protein